MTAPAVSASRSPVAPEITIGEPRIRPPATEDFGDCKIPPTPTLDGARQEYAGVTQRMAEVTRTHALNWVKHIFHNAAPAEFPDQLSPEDINKMEADYKTAYGTDRKLEMLSRSPGPKNIQFAIREKDSERYLAIYSLDLSKLTEKRIAIDTVLVNPCISEMRGQNVR